MDLAFNINEDRNKMLLSTLRKKLAQVKFGGGKNRIEKQHAQGKLTARERIDFLFDHPKQAIEIGALAGEGMYEHEGAAPREGLL